MNSAADLGGIFIVPDVTALAFAQMKEAGKHLLEFMENFILFATHVDCQCTGLLESFSSDDGRHTYRTLIS